MVDWSNPTHFQVKALYEALLFAYPNPADFRTFLFLALGKNFAQLFNANTSYKNGLLDVLLLAMGEGWLDDLVKYASRDKPQSPKLLTLDHSFELIKVDVPDSIGRTLEDIVRDEAGFTDLIPWIQKMGELARKVCRIEYPINTARGTGWLVGSDQLITNWHVIDRALPGGDWDAENFVCRFDYATTRDGTPPGVEVRLAPDWCINASPPSSSELGNGEQEPTADTLDYALLKLDRPFALELDFTGEKRGWVELTPNKSLPQDNEIVFVVQHPDGLPVKLGIGDVKGTSNDKLRIYHTANTFQGSSGAIVVNSNLEPVALHHAGDLLYRKRGQIGAPEKNQAVPIGRIVSHLSEKGCQVGS